MWNEVSRIEENITNFWLQISLFWEKQIWLYKILKVDSRMCLQRAKWDTIYDHLQLQEKFNIVLFKYIFENISIFCIEI